MKTIKDQPILLPDGKQVKVGMVVFEVQTKEMTSYREGRYVLSWSGKSRASLVRHKVIGVNSSSTVRSFTLQTGKGCEITFSVRDSCISSKLFSLKAAALKEMKEVDLEDITTIKTKMEEKREHLAKEVKKYQKTIADISKASKKHK